MDDGELETEIDWKPDLFHISNSKSPTSGNQEHQNSFPTGLPYSPAKGDAGQYFTEECEAEKLEDVEADWLQWREEFICYFSKPTVFWMWGRVQVCVVKGSLSAMGFNITGPHKKFRTLYSPKSHSLMKLSTDDDCASVPTVDNSENNNFDFPPKLVNKIQQSSTVVLFRKCRDVGGDVIGKYFHLYPSDNQLQSLLPRATVRGLGSIFVNAVNSHHLRTYQDNPNWGSILSHIKGLACSGGQPKVTLCGGKGVGKSSLLRYLINACLPDCGGVLVLDVDPGQSEFTVPGCISLLHVTEPLLGPNYTHLQSNPLRSLFLGVISVADEPWRYIKGVRYVWECVLPPDLLKLPLFINTMGWNKGLGVDLLADVLRITRPSCVVSIISSSGHANFADLRPHHMNSMTSILNGENHDSPKPLNYDLLSVKSLSEGNGGLYRRTEGFGKPSVLRDLVVLSYFSRLYEDGTPISKSVNCFTPCKISWDRVCVHSCHSPVPDDQILYVLNGSLVALASVDKNSLKEFTKHLGITILKNFPFVEVQGFGIVRGIDPVERTFYMITPVNLLGEDNINCFLLGSVYLPNVLRLETGGPYVVNQMGGESLFHNVRGRTNKRKHSKVM